MGASLSAAKVCTGLCEMQAVRGVQRRSCGAPEREALKSLIGALKKLKEDVVYCATVKEN
jgi:hypothetical protein